MTAVRSDLVLNEVVKTDGAIREPDLGLALDHLPGLFGTVDDDRPGRNLDVVAEPMRIVGVQVRRFEDADVDLGVVAVLPQVCSGRDMLYHTHTRRRRGGGWRGGGEGVSEKRAPTPILGLLFLELFWMSLS